MRIIFSIIAILFAFNASAQVLYTKDGRSISGPQVAMGLVDGAEIINLTGFNNSVSTSEETYWPGSSSFAWPTSATAATISSGSANDDGAPVGTGCNTARVRYINSTYDEVNEVLTLDGQTGVSLSATTLGVNLIECVAAGTGLTNAGNLYVGTGAVTTGVPATVYNRGDAGYARSGSAFYMVPDDRAVLLLDVDIGVTVAQINYAYLYKQIEGGAFNLIANFISQIDGSFPYRSFANGPIYYPARSKLRLNGVAGASNANGRANLTLLQFDTTKFDMTRFIPVQ